MSTFIPLIEEALTDEEILATHETIVEELRPWRKDKQDFLERIKRMRANDGYHLMLIRDETQKVCSILGYRYLELLCFGKTLFINDFATLSSARRRGFADVLMNWAIEHAKKLDCDQVSLDSGYTRHNAHRFYLNHKFVMQMHHFTRQLK